ncbi:hypothetical protein AB0K09_15090 [Streptomyces sp. NPDC049577]|uniref:hypothetical protein n=1 Tax=Streptomyces sp. NPDC049577 TaxID=3155153 RepID=UPI0034158CD0
MNWTRTAGSVLGAGVLWLACGAVAQPAAAEGPGTVHVLLNGAYDNRPGELVDIDVQGVRSHGEVTVTSPVFPHRVRLAPYHVADGRGHHARPAIAMTVGPGTYPLRVHVGGKVVAEDRVEVKEAGKPVFEAGTAGDVLRPGERFPVSYDDLVPGATGDAFTVTSPVFRGPVRLVHDPRGGYWNNPRMFTALVAVPHDAKDGTYKVRLTGPHGEIDEKALEVRAARPGDSDYLGRARGPAFFAPSGSPQVARKSGHKVVAGGTVNVLWRDGSPDPGEDERLTAISPAFERPVPLKRDESKAGDGDDPRYYGPARVREGLDAGRYPVTVVSHHGRVKRTGHLLVEAAAQASGGGPDRTLLIGGVSAGAVAGTALGVVLVLRRNRARTAGQAPAGVSQPE